MIYRDIVLAALARSCCRVLNVVLDIARFSLWPRRRPTNADRVCVVRHFGLGDVAVSLPALRAIRDAYPGARLTLVTAPQGRSGTGFEGWKLLAREPWLDDIVVLSRGEIETWRGVLSAVRRLHRLRFDVWIELADCDLSMKQLVRNMLFARAVAPHWAGGWELAAVRWAKRAQSEARVFPNEVDRLLSVIAKYGIEKGRGYCRLSSLDAERHKVDVLLNQKNLTAEVLVALAPGAQKPSHRWAPSNFIAVGRRLAESGFSLAIIGGPDERVLCGKIAQAIGSRAVSFAGESDLHESRELLSRCRVLICNDSGVQHLAAAVGTRCLSIFAATAFRGRWWPYGNGHVVLQRWLPCHTCFLDECPQNNRCINLITPEEVVAHAFEMIGKNGGPLAPETRDVWDSGNHIQPF